MHSTQTYSTLSDAVFFSCNLYTDKRHKLPVPQIDTYETFSNTAWSSTCWRNKLHYWYLIQVSEERFLVELIKEVQYYFYNTSACFPHLVQKHIIKKQEAN